jgi:YfiH family protein
MIKHSLLTQVGNIIHGFGTRHESLSDIFPAYSKNRPIQHERHGTRIAVVAREKEDCGEADGMFTDRAGLLLSIATADCVPLLFAKTNGQEVSALHVGWRGAHNGIVQNFVELLHSRGGSPRDWYAAIGPSAGACCYEVSVELIRQFGERFDMPMSVIAPCPPYLNLAGIVHWQLERAGFAQISTSDECTMCHRGNGNGVEGGFSFHSYRRDRATRTPVEDVNWSAIAIANS